MISDWMKEDWKLPPKNRVRFCNNCKLRVVGTASCKKYPTRIPHEVLIQKTPCKEFEPIVKE